MKDLLKIWLPILFLILISFFLTYKFSVEKPIDTLTVATGREDGAYHAYALEYKKLLEKDNILLNIVPTAGSIEALKLLKENKVDVAFVQGGTVDNESRIKLESLGSIYYEPIWIFIKVRH